MDMIKAENVCKTFGTHKALENVSVEIPEGSVYGILGPNGAGKTTLIRIINQILAPDTGTVYFKGVHLSPDDVSRIGYLPEERGLYRKMKVGEQAIYLAQLKGLSRHDALKRLKYWFEKFEMQAWWDKKVEELSKGMAQKVQFVITILHDPELLIFDEPFSGFDPINANMLKNEILDLKAKGKTIIFSTHNMASVEELCDHISLIDKSHVILNGAVHEIRNRFKTGVYELQYVENTIGLREALPMNFEILESKSIVGGTLATIKAPLNVAENELLKCLLDKVQVMSYREVLPGMNEVFISVVSSAGLKAE